MEREELLNTYVVRTCTRRRLRNTQKKFIAYSFVGCLCSADWAQSRVNHVGHAFAHRWRSPPRVRQHRAVGPQGSSSCCCCCVLHINRWGLNHTPPNIHTCTWLPIRYNSILVCWTGQRSEEHLQSSNESMKTKQNKNKTKTTKIKEQ